MSQVIGKSIKAPKIIRTGMPEIEEYTCPEYPKWIDVLGGKRVLVQDQAAEVATLEKATQGKKS